MTLATISAGLAILAWIGLIIGLVVLVVVVGLLREVASAVRGIHSNVRDAPEVAPFLVNGINGVDELRKTHQLASSVPPLAEAYLAKLSSGTGRPAPTRAPSPQAGSESSVGISQGKD